MPPSYSDELVDVTDDAGTVIGVATRREMRARNLPHRCTYVLVFNRRGDLFVHQRTATKDVNPSFWDVAAGGVLAAGESFDDSARRALFEELGVAAAPEPLFPFRYADDRSTVHVVYRVTHDGRSGSSRKSRWRRVRAGRGVGTVVCGMPVLSDGVEIWREFERRFSV